MTTARSPQRHPDSAFRRIGDEGGLVVLPGRAEVKVLNPVAIDIFGLLDGEHTVDAIVAEICEGYEVSEDEARRDVVEFLAELERHGMLAGAVSD